MRSRPTSPRSRYRLSHSFCVDVFRCPVLYLVRIYRKELLFRRCCEPLFRFPWIFDFLVILLGASRLRFAITHNIEGYRSLGLIL